jgi:cephalosporin hydroxylase
MKKESVQLFQDDCRAEIAAQGASGDARRASLDWMRLTGATKYSFHFEWLGRPIIQYPQDIVAFQEIVHQVRPDVIVETGIAHGGSLVLSASLLTLLDVIDGRDPWQSPRKVIGVDIEIRPHNRAALDAHPLRRKMELIEGSSIAAAVVADVHRRVSDIAERGTGRVLVCLDSNHTHAHVLAELEAYAPLVTPGSYCIVFDTVIEDLPETSSPGRPWGRGDSPKTAVVEYLARLADEGRTATDGRPLRLEVDETVENKLLITVAPQGYLRRAHSHDIH